ncbi:Ras guanine nucleotide exchange factor D [Thelohanellus kitauei]|uniref:Ras guanine nucleotide exchange factor D n=1 Tax=Thelohanellus kitauei TaxID=669202 RepID=A0A0C2MJ21_THEKT|nr:Ras guanine nucleotide exchange factor D [Thelohanellus kitauei]
MIRQSNKLGKLVTAEIVFGEKLENRVKALSFYITLSQKLLNLGNLNSSRIIVGGLQNQAVHRLRETWAQLDQRKKKMFGYLLSVYDFSTNYHDYYRIISSKLKENAPLLPFLGYLLSRVVSIISIKELKEANKKNFNGFGAYSRSSGAIASESEIHFISVTVVTEDPKIHAKNEQTQQEMLNSNESLNIYSKLEPNKRDTTFEFIIL